MNIYNSNFLVYAFAITYFVSSSLCFVVATRKGILSNKFFMFTTLCPFITLIFALVRPTRGDEHNPKISYLNYIVYGLVVFTLSTIARYNPSLITNLF